MPLETANLPEALRRRFRERLNEWADAVAGGSAGDFAHYRHMCGVIEGLALAERDLLDLVQELRDDD